MPYLFQRRPAAGLALALALSAAPAAAYAQVAYDFNLPAEPLADSLRAIGAKADVNVAFAPADVRGKRAPRLRGSFIARDALSRAIEGSGLTLRMTSGGSYIVEGADPPPPSAGQSSQASTPTTISELVITADKAGLLERRPNDTVFGLTKPLIETPRSASIVSATTIERYGIQTINDFVAVSPSTYTASFYGIPGSLDVRGTLADNYFLGFKLIENVGTYSTPIGDASQIEIVRGPPSPIYGPGKVGGFLNFIPKTADSQNLSAPTAEIQASYGSYDLVNVNGQFGTPLQLGTIQGGLYAYGEFGDGGSFYDGIHPKRETGEISVNFDLGRGWKIFADALIYHSTGDVQTPGWNRLTPQLINSQTYVSGHNITLVATPGAGYLTPDQATPTEFAPYPFNFTAVGGGLYAGYFGGPPSAPPLPDFQLNSAGAGTPVTLSPHDVYVGYASFSKTFTPAVVAGVSKELPGDSTLKLQFFYNGLDNQRFVSYGFPSWQRANVYEARLTYDFKLSGFDGAVTTNTIVGGSYRHNQDRDMASYDDGLIALDRRDLSVGATPTDTICDPFTVGDRGDQVPANCQGWEFDVHTTESDAGVFAMTDIMIGRRLDIMLGGRYDAYRVRSTDTGILANPAGLEYDSPGPVSASKGEPSYTVSASFKLGWGLMPYVTYAKDNALEGEGDVLTNELQGVTWISKSDLTEGGLKFQLLGNTLVGSLDGYLQNRASITGLNNISQRTRSTGFEYEIRWLATKNISFTLSGNSQHTEVIGPDNGTYYVPAYAVCGNNLGCELNSWGGAYLVFDFATSPLGHPGNYGLSTIPHAVNSFYANYITDEHEWGRFGVTVGATYVTHTSGTIVGAVVYPAYGIVNASVFYQKGRYELDLSATNLFNTLYFTPNSDPTYVNVSVLPGIGQEWRATLKVRF